MKNLDVKALFPGIDISDIGVLPLLDRFHEGIIITDHHGRILFMNQIQEEIDDLKLADVVGDSVVDVYRVDDEESPAMRCLRSGERIDNLACFYRTRLGKVVNSLHNIVPLYAGSRLIGSICFIRAYGLLENELESFSKPETLKCFPQKDRARYAPKSIDNGTRFVFKDIIGQSPNFQEAVDVSKLAAKSMSTVLLSGETGAGKELFAQSIHNQSHRRKNAYVALNCAAIPENLLEGVLFGTTRGAFTGAADKPGLLEKAEGGTLFLDEINSMPMGLQVKLLRVLQERKVRRVGALDEIQLDVKIISSVNEDPHTAVMNGRLRPDLLYRLGVMFIRIPPLRERRRDIPLLVSHFIQKFNRLMEKEVKGVSDSVMDLFHRYTWHGNVRELEHVLEGAMNLADLHKTIRVRHLSHHICDLSSMAWKKTAAGLASFPAGQDTGSESAGDGGAGSGASLPRARGAAQGHPLKETRQEYEERTIRRNLEIAGGNVARAARQMNLSPQTLHYKLKKYRIQAQDFKPLW